MIDTVKISIFYKERPEWLSSLSTATNLHSNSGVRTTTVYPSNSYKQQGIYLPQLKYIEQPATKVRDRNYSLNIELSLPKLFFGNNFNELSDDLFPFVVSELSTLLESVYGINVSESQLYNADVKRIDYSKNTIFNDRTPVSSIISSIKLAEISKTYDFQNTDFKNGGQILHIHANSIDIVMYDKVADLRQSKVSDKRSLENYGYSQLQLLDIFDNHKELSVARFEIRLNNKRKIKSELKSIGINDELRFEQLFSSVLSRSILLKHWQKIFNQIPKLETVSGTSAQLLVAIKQTNPDMKFAQANSMVLIQNLRKELNEERAVRNIIEGLFGTAQYYRLMKISRVIPENSQLKDLIRISNSINDMKPINIDEFT